MGRIFISYSTRNQKVANALCQYLEQQGVRCWIAPRDIPSASNYAGEITRAIKSCERFLLVYSKDACKSEHVKNEINLAINNAKPILPYCLDNSPYDDDLEYYLATKQRIASSGDQEQDFRSIAEILLGHSVTQTLEKPAAAVPETSGKKASKAPLFYGIGALVVVAFLVWLFFLKPDPGPESPAGAAAAVDTTAVSPEVRRDTSVTSATAGTGKVDTGKDKPKKEEVKDVTADTFTGTIKNGYPDGYGTYTFRQPRRIDMHDTEKRMAQKGDYIKGDWSNGHLNYGEWYGADGVKKGNIELGDHPADADHVFAKCVKP
ncbi:MAG: toll/interleukin-1 receptor domain-containing protein [Bacteroidales bacterium]|nr:toll/interleukin-1 receptor domain-containing protein [Bacteroidales bacterium]